MQGPEKEQLKKQFGEVINRERKARGLSLRDFAALADMEHKHVDEIERGRLNPSLTTIAKIANALQMDLSELFRGIGNSPTP